MPLRFRRSIKLGPGVRLNVGKKSAGVSFGVRGMRYSVSSSGRRTTTVGIPGTGLSSVNTSSRSRRRAEQSTTTAPSGSSGLPKPGLLSPAAEKRFYEGVKAYLSGNKEKALLAFEAASLADTRNISDDFFAGLCASQLDQTLKAIGYLEKVVRSDIALPDQLMSKYLPAGKAQLTLIVQVTPRIGCEVAFDSLGAALLLAELYQSSGRREEAIGLLQQLVEGLEGESAMRLSLCDLLFEEADDQGVVETAVGMENDSDIGLACLHLKAQSLARLGMRDGALDTLAACLKKTAGRDKDLLRDIQYDRGVLLESMGQNSRAKRDFEKIFAADPTYRDVAQRLRA